MTTREIYLGAHNAGPEGWTSEMLAIPAKGITITREQLFDRDVVRFVIEIPASNLVKARHCDLAALTAGELAWKP